MFAAPREVTHQKPQFKSKAREFSLAFINYDFPLEHSSIY